LPGEVGGPEDAVAETSAVYDLIAEDYETRTRQTSPEYALFREQFIVALPRGGTVLDVGCGPGRDAGFFRKAGLLCFGLDLSEAMLRLACRSTSVVRGDLRALPVRSNCLDGIWSGASLLHVPREQVRATLDGWHGALSPGGVAGLSTSVGHDEGWELVPAREDHRINEPSVRRWFVHHDPDDLCSLVQSAGFDVVSAATRVSHRTWVQVLARKCPPRQ